MTALLNGQAVKRGLGSIKVTATLPARRFKLRAQVAPANPPPTTTMLALVCPSTAGAAITAAPAAAMVLRTALRLVLILPGRVPFGDCTNLLIGKSFGDAIHHRCFASARAKVGHC